MALTKIGKEGITGVSNSADATFLTATSGEGVTLAGTLAVTGVHTVGTNAVATSEGGAATTSVVQGLAKCWIKFNLSGTIAINDSFNASGITDNAVGKYDVAIGNNMNSVDYSVTSSAAFDDGGIGSDISCCRPDATTGYDGSNNLGSNGSARDAQYNSSTTHGDLA